MSSFRQKSATICEYNADGNSTARFFKTASAPMYNGILNFTVEKAFPVFWPGNTIAGCFEPEMDVRIALVLIAFYNGGKIHVTQGPVIVAETLVANGKHAFELVIPDKANGQSLPMSFRDESVKIEYRLVGYDLGTNEQLRGHLPIQVMTPIMINEHNHRVMRTEKKLKYLGLFAAGEIKIGIRINNPELRPGEDISMKLVYNGNKRRRLKRIVISLVQRISYNIGKDPLALFPPQKDNLIHKVKQTFSRSLSFENEDMMRIPLSLSLPPLQPSTQKTATYGNYIRVSYLIKLKVVMEGYANNWEIPIHVGTTAVHPQLSTDNPAGQMLDMEYAILRKDTESEHNNIYGILFTKLSSPWPTENNTEQIAIQIDKVNTPLGSEKSECSLGTGQGPITGPLDLRETQLSLGDVTALSLSAEKKSVHSLQNYIPIN